MCIKKLMAIKAIMKSAMARPLSWEKGEEKEKCESNFFQAYIKKKRKFFKGHAGALQYAS